MVNRYRQQWEELGNADPYWAVLTHPDSKDGGWNKTQFFQTGSNEISKVLNKISQLDIPLGSGLALDYGCGVGRLSRALSKSFQRVLGVDISESMLSEALSANAGFDNIQFLHGNGSDLAGIADGTVDFVYSNMVLQHSPRTIQCQLIKDFCRVLRPGGLLVFQTPSQHNLRNLKGFCHCLMGNRIFNIARAIKHGKTRVMEMHTLEKYEAIKLLEAGKMALIEAERYDSAGPAFISYRYFAVKNP